MPIAARLIRQPLVHFIVAGALLFGAWTIFEGDQAATDDTGTIVVDRRALLSFLQYRANAFEPASFGAALDAMSDAELDEIVAAFIDEEVLYREARELGLEESDNIIRQRMVQKMSFLLADIAATERAPERAALEAYFEANIEAYAVQPWSTFTHVFFDLSRHGEAGARQAAEAAQRMLNQSAAGFNDTVDVGDRFPFLRNYVERTYEHVASHFGYDFAERLAALEPSTQWQGPISSVYGSHVVLLTRSEPGRLPALDEILSEVEHDYASEQENLARAELLETIRARYRIEIEDFGGGSGP